VQSGHKFNKKLADALKAAGYNQAKSNPCVFYKDSGRDLKLVSTYVDDLKLFSKDPKKDIEFLRAKLPFESTVNLNQVFLGVESTKLPNGDLLLHQSSYVKNMIANAKLVGAQKTPLLAGAMTLTPELDANPTLVHAFQQRLGELNFVANATRPDITFACNYMAQYATRCSNLHLEHLNGILRYLSNEPSRGITIKAAPKDTKFCQNSPAAITVYSDANWGDKTDGTSISGIAVYFESSLIDWASRKQKCIAQSTMEAEYVAASEAIKTALPVTFLLEELKIAFKPPRLLVDNESAIHLISNPMSGSKRSRHINIRYHFIQQAFANGEITVEHVTSNENVADGFTKALGAARFRDFAKQLEQLPALAKQQ
jgi:hypothetical protein